MNEEQRFCRDIEKKWDKLINLGFSQQQLRDLDFEQQVKFVLAGLEDDKSADNVLRLIQKGKLLRPKSDKVFIAGQGDQDWYYGFNMHNVEELPFSFEDLKHYQLSKCADKRYKRQIGIFLSHQATVRRPSPELKQLLLESYAPLIDKYVSIYQRRQQKANRALGAGGPDKEELNWIRKLITEEAKNAIEEFKFYWRKDFDKREELRPLGTITGAANSENTEIPLTHFLEIKLNRKVKELVCVEKGFISLDKMKEDQDEEADNFAQLDKVFASATDDCLDEEGRPLLAKHKVYTKAIEPVIINGEKQWLSEPIIINGEKYWLRDSILNHLGISKRTLYRKKKTGEIKSHKWKHLEPTLEGKPRKYNLYEISDEEPK